VLGSAGRGGGGVFISCQETVGPHNILVWVHIRNALCHVIVPTVTRGVALQARGQQQGLLVATAAGAGTRHPCWHAY
jgi:hypothetical protein